MGLYDLPGGKAKRADLECMMEIVVNSDKERELLQEARKINLVNSAFERVYDKLTWLEKVPLLFSPPQLRRLDFRLGHLHGDIP